MMSYPAGSTNDTPLFQETLSPRRNTTDLAIAVGGVMLVIGVIPATVVLLAKALNNILWITVIIVMWGVAAGIGRIFWNKRETTVGVRVTKTGVHLHQNPPPILGTGSVFIRFDDIKRVQYSSPDSGEHIHLTDADKKQAAQQITSEDEPIRFMVARQHSANAYDTGSYLGGVRIGRKNNPPVYTGSDEPERLATVIAEHSDAVSTPEKFLN